MDLNIELFKHDTRCTYQTIVLLFYFYSFNYLQLSTILIETKELSVIIK